MGCTQSKIEHEENVSRCKDRRHFMKSAIANRNAFAAAHSSYVISLKNSGAALSDFASGEASASVSVSGGVVAGEVISSQPPIQNLPPPPPPIPLQRAVSMPEFVVSKDRNHGLEPTIKEEDEEEEEGRSEIEPPPSPPPVVMEENRGPPAMEVGGSSWDYFFNVGIMSLGGGEENARKMFDEMPRRGLESSLGNSVKGVGEGKLQMEKNQKMVVEKPVLQPLKMGKPSTSANGGGSGGGEVKRRNVNMVQVFTELDDCFLAASQSASEVTKLLEAARLHFHSNFADKNGHIDHSARVLQVITWNRSIKGLPNNGEYKDDFDSEENETHATVLDKLLAWEKKLYDEVKAGEIMKFEYQKKVASLNKQKKRGANTEALEKLKATVSHLHTRYIVDMQTMDSTVSEINCLRDKQLYPKLVTLVDAMATMWGSMQGYHEKQHNIALVLRAVDISKSTKETTDHHHDRTIQLWGVVQEWHMQFEKMVNYQKEYIRALNSWLKLNLIPIESSLKEKVSSPPRVKKPPIQKLLLAWHDLLDKLPDEHAKSAIHNFGEVIHTIVQQQEDELKLKAKMEESKKDLEKKQRQFNKWVKEYTQKRMTPDEMEASSGEEGVRKDEIMVQKEFVVETAKKKLEEDTENYQRQCLHVRDKSLTSLKTRLPDLFRALSDFSGASSEMYQNLKSISDSLNHVGREAVA